MEFYGKRTISGIKPSDSNSEDEYLKLKPNLVYKIKVTKSRNYEFHKKYFKLIRTIFNNQDKFINKDDFLKAVKIEIGLYDIKQDLKGNTFLDLHSISFDKMDELEFQEVYKKTLSCLSKFIGYSEKALEMEILENYM